jgi:hypothetical protein
MREDPIIKKEWSLLKKIVEGSNVVDIYDSSTWGSDDLEPVFNIVLRQIAPHKNHQQRTESGVKGIADQSRTGSGKDRLNACNIIHYYFTRKHNKSAKDLKLDVKWMQCAGNIANYIDSTKSLIEQIQNTEAWIGKDKCIELFNQFHCWELTQWERGKELKVAAFSKYLESISFVMTLKAECP